jgi:hypothetical protein
MSIKYLLVVSVISFAAISLLQAQSPTPAESPAASPAKHRTHKKVEAAESPAAGTEASPSPADKRGIKEKTAAEASQPPAGAAVSASPAAKGGRKTKTTAAPAAVSPSPSPARKTLADLFKPKTSASPAAAVAPAATGVTTAETVAKSAPAPGGGHGLVWVNTETHVYHKEGTRFYGKTKKGKYVTEQEAIKEGDKAAKRE